MIIIFSSIGLFGHKVFMMNVKQINSLYRQTATFNIESINQFVLLHLQVLIGSHMCLSEVCNKRDVTFLGNIWQWRQNRGKKLGAQID